MNDEVAKALTSLEGEDASSKSIFDVEDVEEESSFGNRKSSAATYREGEAVTIQKKSNKIYVVIIVMLALAVAIVGGLLVFKTVSPSDMSAPPAGDATIYSEDGGVTFNVQESESSGVTGSGSEVSETIVEANPDGGN